MHRLLCLIAVCVLAFAPPAVGQSVQTKPGQPPTPQLPPRDKAAAKSGTASIYGRIVAADSGAAVRRARVSLSSTSNPLDTRSTTTDLDGRYEFTELPAGTYRVSASKGLFVPLQYGQRRSSDSGQPVELTDGQKAEKIDISLPRGAVIAGVLLDDVGEAATSVRVTAMRQQFRNGKRELVNSGRSVETNDRGEYRLFGLTPGTYFVAAMPATANPLVPMLSSPSGAPTYYPGTLNQFEAQSVAARTGQEQVLPDFTLVPSRLVKITGTAANASGAPAQMVMLVSGGQATPGEAAEMPGMTMGTVQPDGAFRLNNVAPGEYMLMGTWLGASGEPGMASMPLTIAGEDISGIVLTSPKGFQVRGQILFDEGAPPAGLSPSAVTLVAAPASPGTMSGGMGRVTIRDDWTFEANGLAGERRFQFAMGLPPGWMVKSAFHGSVDITDKPLHVTEDLDRIVIALTGRSASLSGVVTNAAGKPVTDGTVVIFPDDPAQGPPHSQRYVRALRPDEGGKFNAQRLPAATYLVIALETLESGEEHDPELLEQLRPQATRVMLGWGEVREVPLRITPFERR
jgi:hypothetical protein